jgi:3-oxoacyl-[acyl-carrier protein] reductase
VSRILVTGGSGGIGEALVRRLRGDGHDVVFTFCRGAERARRLEEATGARPVRYDQSSTALVQDLASLVRKGDFDALVNNGGEPPKRQLLVKTDADQFMACQVNALRGVLELSNAFAARARERQTGGAIVNVLTTYTLGVPPAKLAAYVTSKYALLGLTRSMAVEFIRYGVRVNAVSPGVTRTEFIADLPEMFVEQLEAGLPMRRLATPQEVAAVICFLLSLDASYINGANLPVTGGQSC